MAVAEDLIQQYAHAFKMIGAGIEQCTDNQWTAVVDDSFFVPSRVTFHIIISMDFYASPVASEFDWQVFDFNWQEASGDELPSRSVVTDYLAKVKDKVDSSLSAADDSSLLGTDDTFSPRFSSPLARLMYSLRHAHHHIGQLSLDLQRRGLPEISW